MILLRPTQTGHEEIATSWSYTKLLSVLDNITERYESEGKFLVKEEYIIPKTIVREFATIKDGLVDTLIICGGVATGIKEVE